MSLVLREIGTLGFYFTPRRMAYMNNEGNDVLGKMWRKRNSVYNAGGKANCAVIMENS